MDSSVWAITGFQIESFDTVPPTEEDLKYYFDARFIQTTKIIGQLNETPKTVMHGVSSMGHDKPTGYAFVEVSLQRMEDFEKTPLDGRGLGAVTGGFITSTIIGADGGLLENTAVDEQQWGVIDTSKARHLCGFYSSKLEKFYHVMICFARTNVAAVSGFWRNGKVIIGPDVQCRETDWGADIRSNPCILYRYPGSGPPRIQKPPVGAGNHTLVLEEGKCL